MNALHLWRFLQGVCGICGKVVVKVDVVPEIQISVWYLGVWYLWYAASPEGI